MATDVRLDEGSSNSWVAVDAAALVVTGPDLILNAASRRRATSGHRRALVHDERDGLTVNFNGDYPAGVQINDVRMSIHCDYQDGSPKLPKEGGVGDLLVTQNTTRIEGGPAVGETVTLWLCVGRSTLTIAGGRGASWLPILTGAAVIGSA